MILRRASIVAGAAVLVFAAARCGNGSLTVGSAGQTLTTVATRAVSVRDTAFSPVNIQVAPGDTVTFTNFDNTPHNATFASTSIVSTGDFTTGAKTVVMPLAVGTYTYRCTIHPIMTGSVVVQAP